MSLICFCSSSTAESNSRENSRKGESSFSFPGTVHVRSYLFCCSYSQRKSVAGSYAPSAADKMPSLVLLCPYYMRNTAEMCYEEPFLTQLHWKVLFPQLCLLVGCRLLCLPCLACSLIAGGSLISGPTTFCRCSTSARVVFMLLTSDKHELSSTCVKVTHRPEDGLCFSIKLFFF